MASSGMVHLISFMIIICFVQFATLFASDDNVNDKTSLSPDGHSNEEGEDSNKNPSTNSITLLASFNNKKRYFSSEVFVNRDQAKELCEHNGMKLVTVDSDEELDFLGSNLPRRRYWTSGKSTNSYKWNDGKGKDVTSPVYVFNRISCVVIYWSVLNTTNFYGDPCDGSLASDYRPLCEAYITD